jgi:hypothetical protein
MTITDEEESTTEGTPPTVDDDITDAAPASLPSSSSAKKPKRKSSNHKSSSSSTTMKKSSSKRKSSISTKKKKDGEDSVTFSVDPEAVVVGDYEKGEEDDDDEPVSTSKKDPTKKRKSKTNKKDVKKDDLLAVRAVANASSGAAANDVIPDDEQHGRRNGCFAPAVSAQDAQALDTFLQRQFRRMARNPCIHLWTAMVISLALSFIALIVGEFSVSAETGGWQSRGTTIADRQAQLMMAVEYQDYLAYGGEDAWNDLIQNVQTGWESDSDDDDGRRRLTATTTTLMEEGEKMASSRSHVSFPAETFADWLQPKSSAIDQARQASPTVLDSSTSSNRFVPFRLTDEQYRRLQDESSSDSNNPLLSGCDMSFYQPTVMTWESRLWPVWQTNSASTTALDADVLRQQCQAEANTQSILEENGLCFGCPDNKCLPPFSIVFYARLQVEDGFVLTCDELAEAWRPMQSPTEQEWQECVTTLKETYDPNNAYELPPNCPFGFYPTLVQTDFDTTLVTQYTSTIFATKSDDDTIDEMYAKYESFDRGSGGLITAAYDTQYEDFANLYVDSSLGKDMALALGSAVVVSLAIMVHTRSPLITGVGLLQIVLSFPLSYFVYKIVAGLDFFPFLNFLGTMIGFVLKGLRAIV